MGSILLVLREITSVAEWNRPSAVSAAIARMRKYRLIPRPTGPCSYRAASGLAECEPERQRPGKALAQGQASVPFRLRLALRGRGIRNNHRRYKRPCRFWHFRLERYPLSAPRSLTAPPRLNVPAQTQPNAPKRPPTPPGQPPLSRRCTGRGRCHPAAEDFSSLTFSGAA